MTHDSTDFVGVPKMGGGIDVFRSGEARMGGEGDEDDEEDEEDNGDDKRFSKRWFVRGRKQNSQPHNRKLRWNKFKWILFVSNIIVSLRFRYFIGLVFMVEFFLSFS